jgi:hypothetical protein
LAGSARLPGKMRKTKEEARHFQEHAHFTDYLRRVRRLQHIEYFFNFGFGTE